MKMGSARKWVCRLMLTCMGLGTTVSALAFDESINFQPGVNLYQSADWLKDLIGPNGSQLCGPVAVTQWMSYFKYAFEPAFQKLLDVADIDHDGKMTYGDYIRHFVQACHTNVFGNGTKVRSLLACMRQYAQDSGYTPYIYMLGPHAPDAPNGDMSQVHRMVDTDVIRNYVSNKLPLIMFVSWFTYDSTTRTYTRFMSHYITVFGYDYNYAWDKSRIILKVVNSSVDYSSRADGQTYDDIEMTQLPNDGSIYPTLVGYQLSGNGFDSPPYKAMVENVYFGAPISQ